MFGVFFVPLASLFDSWVLGHSVLFVPGRVDRHGMSEVTCGLGASRMPTAS